MQESSRAMVFCGPGQPLELRTFPLPVLRDGEALVRVRLCTLCGSDLHSYEGHRPTPTPTILGHEILGEIVELAPSRPPADFNGRRLSVGQRVTWTVAASCGRCENCGRGIPQKCDQLFKYGHQSLSDEHPLSGGLAEYCHLAAGTSLVAVPDDLPDRVACPASCAAATVAAAFRTAGICRDRTVLVQGLGMLGLTACALAQHEGAREVIATDPDARRCVWARRFGATSVVSNSDELAAAVTDATAGRGVDLALEFCGAPTAVEQAIPLLAVAARYVLVGAVFPARPAQIPAEMLVRRLIRLEGVHNYTPADLAHAVRFLGDLHRRLPFADLVADPVPLEAADSAFRSAAGGSFLRLAICP